MDNFEGEVAAHCKV